MFVRRVIVGSLAVLSVGFSFADFQSELEQCYNGKQDYQKCSATVRSKYMVSKKKACSFSDGVYNQPIQASWPKKKVTTEQFYKYANKIYYPLTVNAIDGSTECLMGTEYYTYSYDCKTKKAMDLRIKIDQCGVKIDYANKGKILLKDLQYEGGNLSLRIFDINSMTIDNLDITTFRGFKDYKEYIRGQLQSLFNTTKSKEIGAGNPTKIAAGKFDDYWNDISNNFPNNEYDGYIRLKDITSNFVAKLEYSVSLDNGSFPLQGGTVDLLKRAITIKK